jgi:alpha-galactosidase
MFLLGILSPLQTEFESPVYFRYNPDSGWDVGNDQFHARFRHMPDGTLRWLDLEDSTAYPLWRGTSLRPSSPISFRIDNEFLNAQTRWTLISQRSQALRNEGQALLITFQDQLSRFEAELTLSVFPGQPILRQQVRLKNLTARRVHVRAADLLPYSARIEDTEYRAFRVNQWSTLNTNRNFESLSTTLFQPAQRITMQTGAGGFQCTWLAIRKNDDVGLIAGWEFDGRADAVFERKAETVDLNVSVNSLYHPLESQQVFTAPAAFIGIFIGDWDEAGYRTQRFVEAALAAPIPEPEKFPYIAWDSWGHQAKINEQNLRREAERAAQLGVELFIVDLGWAKRMGDWEADPEKFPSGMRAFSDYVHSLGMKFGLHFVISEAMKDSEVLKQNPDWTSSTNYNYHGAESLCLAHKPVQDWVIAQGVKLIRENNVDWVLQDGQTMVKACTKRSHSHDYRDANYSGDLGLTRILSEIQRQTPGVVWENCANGGNMMTFRMVSNYVTSITNDASGALGSRQGLFGASFPFPPRYTDRYMSAETMNDYTTRSYMFGGPWILMNKLMDLPTADLDFLASEVRVYKDIRRSIRDGKVAHLTARPDQGRIDAIQSYNPATDEAIAVVTRDDAAAANYTLRFRDLIPTNTYWVRFQDSSRTYTMTGEQLARSGVVVNLPDRESGEIVYAKPLPK